MKLTIYLLLATTIAVASAQPDFAPIRQKGIYGTLLDTIGFTGIDAIISENAPVTIIGPSDQAFGEVAGVIATLSTEEIKQIVLNHIVPNATITSDVLRKEGCMVVKTIGGLEVSLFRDPITFEMDVDNDLIVDPDVAGDYGVLHGIEDVIIADQHGFLGCPSFSDLSAISDKEDFSTLLGLIEQTHNHFTITMNTENTTIFGPTNAAFTAAQGQLDSLTEDQLDQVVRDHMVFGEILTEEVIAFGCVEKNTLAGTTLAIRFDESSGAASVNGVPISATEIDIRGEYFVLHGIEGTLVEAQYVPCAQEPLDFSPVVETGEYSTFLDLVDQTTLSDDISMKRPNTILAPTDAAFARAQSVVSGLSDEEMAAAIQVALANHVINGTIIDSASVVAEECIEAETVGGYPVSINFDIVTGQITVNGIAVVQTNITGNFGILHGIDGVIGIDGEYAPCSPYSEIEFLSNFFEIDINAAADDEPITVFGPRNDALFSLDIYPFDGVGSRQNEMDLVLGHIVAGVHTAEEVKKAGCVVLETFAGTRVRVIWVEDGPGHSGGMRRRRLAGHGGANMGVVMVNDAKVILADQSNGDNANIFHGIDKVILPGSFSECPVNMPPSMPPVAPPPTQQATPAAPTVAPAESGAFSSGLSITAIHILALVALLSQR
ncbi:unnamed protein product [Cylindrotheca closterium]|uniref:FAS1 domain-containing protein n=1 Tax=Cylindrotheca closterium TaxID=2856 RepID=A0AAD2CSV3_9STRA|nr:unnamed protein product [Cylindrotheca closterium]